MCCGTCLFTEEKYPYPESLRIREPPKLLFPTSWTISHEWSWQLLPTGIPFPLQPCHGGHRWSKKRCQVLSWKICVVFTLKLSGEADCAEAALRTLWVQTPPRLQAAPQRDQSPPTSLWVCVGPLCAVREPIKAPPAAVPLQTQDRKEERCCSGCCTGNHSES